MGFTPYTQPQKPAAYEPPIPMELMLKGAVYKQGQAEAGLKQTTAELDHLASLPTLPGRDTEIKNEKIKALTDSMKGLAIQDLGSLGTLSKIHSSIGQLTQDSDFQTVVQRGMLAQSEQKKVDEFASKNKTYISPILENLNDYTQNHSLKGEYIKNLDLSEPGFVQADTGDLMKKVKEVTRTVDTYQTVNGVRKLVKKYDPEDLQKNIDLIINQDHNYQLGQNHQFKQATKNVVWADEAVKKFTPHIETEQSIIDQANSAMHLTKDPNELKYYQNVIAQAQDNISKYSDLINNPHTENELKSALREELTQSETAKMVEAMNSVQESDDKLDERVQMAMQLQNEITKKQYDFQLDLLKEQGMIKPNYDAQGNVIFDKNGNMSFSVVKPGTPGALPSTTDLAIAKAQAAIDAKAATKVDPSTGLVKNELLDEFGSTLSPGVNDVPYDAAFVGWHSNKNAGEGLSNTFIADETGAVGLAKSDKAEWYHIDPVQHTLIDIDMKKKLGAGAYIEHIFRNADGETIGYVANSKGKKVWNTISKASAIEYAKDEAATAAEKRALNNYYNQTPGSQGAVGSIPSYKGTETFHYDGDNKDYTYAEVKAKADKAGVTIEEYVKNTDGLNLK